MAGSGLFLKPPSHLILSSCRLMLSAATPQQEAEQSWGQEVALQQSKGGQEGSFALRTAILISAVAGNSCKLKPDADASSRTPAVTVGTALGKGSRSPAEAMVPHQLGRSYCSESFPGASRGTVNRWKGAQPAKYCVCRSKKQS